VPLNADAQRLERGQYLVRNIVGTSKEHGALAVAHEPKPGDRIGFVLRDGERARGDLKQTLEDLRASLKRPPALGLYFDCVSRGAGLYNIPGHDSAYIRRYLGEFPLGGFFTGFEIGPSAGSTRVLQYTGVLALISSRS
jgi:small ligand-binding sensory domain FIST